MPSEIEPFYAQLGRQLHQQRSRAGLTQEQLGAKLRPSVTRASIANIEAGKQRVLVKMLVDLAEVLDVDVRDLLPPRETANAAVDLRAELERALPPDAEIDVLASRVRHSTERE